MSVYETPSPLCLQSDKAAVRVVLVDAERAPRTRGKTPWLPDSFRGAAGERVEVQDAGGRVVAVGCGKPSAFASAARFWESAGACAIDALRTLRIERASVDAGLDDASPEAAAAFALGATLAAYRCTAYRAHPPRDHFDVRALEVPAAQWQHSRDGCRLGEAANWARALVEAPSNALTPQSFAREAQALAALGVEVEVLDVPALERLGASGLLAVGRASEHPPCMLVCRWRGRDHDSVDLGLVGKGLTFDGGGLNLKPRPGIEKMKFDMAGAAAVIGALRALAGRRAPLNVVAAIPLCENVIDAKAYRPGDVITSLAGLTIEVDNTDAEGRIVLADAIAHLVRAHRPGVLVDVATLTGAILICLHEEYAGLFTADDELARQLDGAGTRSGESLWRLPLSPRQDYIVESEIADLKNMGAPGLFGTCGGSSIAGAKFLEKFAAGTRWAHLDIAGVTWSTRPLPGIPKGPTGFGVRLLDALARELAR